MDFDAMDLQVRLDRFNLDRLKRNQEFFERPQDFGIVFLPNCTIKMLVVLDGFGFHGAQNFGLEEFYTAFAGTQAGVSFQITKAHMGQDNDADIENFLFEDHELDQYDVVWLFGVLGGSGSGLSQEDLRALSQYMDNGGGVFATGDHADLGVRMCGAVPRIRSMRKWHWPSPGPNGEPVAPSGGGTERIDTTVRRSGVLPGQVEFDDQSDFVPQHIMPKYYSSRAPFYWHARYRWPHPVLCGREGVIDVMPDHAHEGECIVPTDLSASFTFDGYTIEEYPVGSNGQRIRPELIAWSRNAEGIVEKGAVNPRIFGTVGVLDGHRASVGRCAVDATWHHFFNINLRGKIGDPNPIQAAGFYYNADGLAALDQIKNYFRNLGIWLARPQRHSCIAWRGWWLTRFDDRISMEVNLRHKTLADVELEELFIIGRHARDVYGKYASQCQSLSYLWWWLKPEIRENLLWPLLPEWAIELTPAEKLLEREADPMSMNVAELALDLLAGAIVHQIGFRFQDKRDFDRAAEIEDGREILEPAVEFALQATKRIARDMTERGETFMRDLDF